MPAVCIFLPGVIDDQVHFREAGTHAQGRFSHRQPRLREGRITTFLEMPNTKAGHDDSGPAG